MPLTAVHTNLGAGTLDRSTGKIYNAHIVGLGATAFCDEFRETPIVSATISIPFPVDMQALPRFEGLESLQLEANADHPPLAATDLAYLANCPSLRTLFICTPLTEDALSGLASCRNLTSLELCEMDISENMLRSLEKLGGLQSLTFKSVNLPEGAVRRLTAALPDCQVVVEGPASELVVGEPAEPGGF